MIVDKPGGTQPRQAATEATAARHSLRSAAAKLRNGELTCVALLEACLEQIDRHEDQVRAWVRIDADGARAQARQLDDELAAGRDRGPLHGIPTSIKDIIDVAGLPTRAGSPLLDGNIAEADAASVKRIRAAGAVIMGKSVTTQFAFDDPPPTRNPWRLNRTPGGSSSGPAAATAAGMCLLSVGTQTGGSLLRPAAYCGVAAVKPTWGRVSVLGVLPLAINLDHVGLMANDVTGLAASLDAITAGGHLDPFTSAVPRLHCSHALAAPASTPRIGVLTGYFERGVDRDVEELVASTLEVAGLAGAHVVRVGPPNSIDTVAEHNHRLLAIQAALAHRERFPSRRDAYLPLLAGLLDEGMAASLADLPEVFLHRARFQRDLMSALRDTDVVVCATTATTAPDVSTTGQSKFNAPFSYAGFPSATLPVGLGRDGMPIGIQLIGRPWGEAELLRAAYWIEQQLPFNASPQFRD